MNGQTGQWEAVNDQATGGCCAAATETTDAVVGEKRRRCDRCDQADHETDNWPLFSMKPLDVGPKPGEVTHDKDAKIYTSLWIALSQHTCAEGRVRTERWVTEVSSTVAESHFHSMVKQ